ncbi:MAG: PadR family transcriptional regulator [Opitutaceae bacterium]|nr:PadR family transcriptional regulator [Opitutaceae bacterium]
MPKNKQDLLQGTLDLLVLRILNSGARHGYDIAKHIQLVSKDVIQVGQGSLYPSLHRLEKRGYIKAKWDISETGRRAKFYQLTADGKKKTSEEENKWQEFTTAVNLILKNG